MRVVLARRLALPKSMSEQGAPQMSDTTVSRSLAGLLAIIACVLVGAAMASSAQAAPSWTLEASHTGTFPLPGTIAPSHAEPGGIVQIALTARNIGTSGTVAGNAYRLKVELPADFSVASVAPANATWNCSATVLGSNEAVCTRTSNLNANANAPMVTVSADVAADAADGPRTVHAEVAGGLSPTLPDGVTACGHASSAPDPFEPSCAESNPVVTVSSDPAFGVLAFDGQVKAGPTPDTNPFSPGAQSPNVLDPSDLANFAAPFTTASAHPYEAATQIRWNSVSTNLEGSAITWPTEPVKDVLVELPPGFLGNLAELPQCSIDELVGAPDDAASSLCPSETQVGELIPESAPITVFGFGLLRYPIYNMVPPTHAPARLAVNIGNTVVVFDAVIRSGDDYGITLVSRNTPQGLAITGADFNVWGVPASSDYDQWRTCPIVGTPLQSGSPCPSSLAEFPILRNPSACTASGTGLITAVHSSSWFNPGRFTADGRPDLSDSDWRSASFESHDPAAFPAPMEAWGDPQGPTGCGSVPFTPTVDVSVGSSRADSPTGLAFDLSVPQDWTDPDGREQSDLKRAVVTLPEGMTVNPSSAGGLEACTSAQIDLDGQNTKPSCPQASKLGAVEIDTPLLDEPLTGGVYLAKQGDNPFDSLIALYIVAEGPGTVIKIPGRVVLDQQTGRLQTAFDDNPQLPFSRLRVEFKGGSRAPLVTPRTCGSYDVVTKLAPWARPSNVLTFTDTFDVVAGPDGSACVGALGARPFAPSLEAGVADAKAGSSSPFALRLMRGDGEQEFDSLAVHTPPGLTAAIKEVTQCSSSDAGAGMCPASSRIGGAVVGAGAGPSPYYVRSGDVFLTGPYKGGPFGLAIEVPAVAGPFDLGVVNVRSRIDVDPETAELTVTSDPLPQMLKGIPLKVKDVRVLVDRPGMVRAPTNCEPMGLQATVRGSDGAFARPSNRFQVDGCGRLGLSPKLRMRAVGRSRMASGGHPALHTRLVQPAGQANIKRVKVTLPKALALDPGNANNEGLLCPYEAGLAANCPASSRIGSVTAISPLLNRPLRGPVYFVQGKRRHPVTGNLIRTFPTLLIKLDGEVELTVRAHSNVVKGRLVTTFPAVPDAAVSRFDLRLNGGKRKGILVVTGRRSLCRGRQAAALAVRGHNDRLTRQTVKLVRPCVKTSRGARAD